MLAVMPASQSVLVHQTAKGNVKAPTFIRYTPDTSAPGFNPNARQRVIRMVEAQVDPMEPPKFKHRKVARGEAQINCRGTFSIFEHAGNRTQARPRLLYR